MFVIGPSARTFNSQTLVYFHDHNTSLQAMHTETPRMNIQLILNFCLDNQLFNIVAVGKCNLELNVVKKNFECFVGA